MNTQKQNLPFEIQVSFHKVVEKYKEQLKLEGNDIARNYIKSILDHVALFPALTEGIKDFEELKTYQEPIRVLLDDLFPNVLTNNEIKAAFVPFENLLFNKSKRLENIIAAIPDDFEVKIENANNNIVYVQECINILNDYYGYTIDYSRPLYFDIPDEKGINRRYRIALNGDFIDIYPKEEAKKITAEDVDELLQNVDDIDLWHKKFPPHSWVFKGFTIVNLVDVTMDDAISELKSTLLFEKSSEKDELEKLEDIFRSIYKIHDLKIGFTLYNSQDKVFEKMEYKEINSYILNNETVGECKKGICNEGFDILFKEHGFFSIANVDEYAKNTKNNKLSKRLLKNGIKSCILAPVVKNNRLLGILELVAKKKHQLNSINTIKLDEILPYIATAMDRNRTEFENRVKAVIQSECTAIHPSVLWVFEREAKQYIIDYDREGLASFKDIVFKNVYPLYGQIDVVASSDSRNKAIQKDLLNQLQEIQYIMHYAYKLEELPIYEQVKFRISDFIEDLERSLNTSSEQKILNLLQKEVDPIINHLAKQSVKLKEIVENYWEKLNPETGIIYKHRKNYDDTIQQINQTMSRFLDRKQMDAQKIYPHYFERYKTDGVDHNMYIGPSMVQDRAFNKVYLYNLRLWQLSTMCEMENRFYQLQQNTPIKLDAASLILVYNSTMSIRYRMDEKKFDVDGTYNARYEIIKKRIDKSFIKGTGERVTKKGKIAIVYSQTADEREYLRYVKYLQTKNYLGDEVELLELEDVQGVVGLKTIRVNILYPADGRKPDKTITYNNLMEELH